MSTTAPVCCSPLSANEVVAGIQQQQLGVLLALCLDVSRHASKSTIAAPCKHASSKPTACLTSASTQHCSTLMRTRMFKLALRDACRPSAHWLHGTCICVPETHVDACTAKVLQRSIVLASTCARLACNGSSKARMWQKSDSMTTPHLVEHPRRCKVRTTCPWWAPHAHANR